ncbi:FIG006611: nucleotidyltransferase [hydrothermal vent metagenome]|uniref:FIG006611: nucleotidyltransferase n=1 Tax=hydrothermal vent metagenome TaxID=652676 RepID=A0A3B0SX96_9ZZZZ
MNRPTHAMIAAAGLGTRMGELTANRPKALVEFAGKTLLDHQLERLAAAGVGQAVVNVHHFADQMQAHLAARKPPPNIQISDERDGLLETGGGLVKAAKYLGKQPFFVINVDSIWTGHETALLELAECKAKNPEALAVLLLARKTQSLGLHTAGDFHMDSTGKVSRRKGEQISEFYYAGAQIFDPAALRGFAETRFSTNLFWDKALAEGRLFGLELDGFWMHVGDPKSLQLAEQKYAKTSK